MKKLKITIDIMKKEYTMDLYNTKKKTVFNYSFSPMTYTQAKTLRSKQTYYKHYDYRIRKITSPCMHCTVTIDRAIIDQTAYCSSCSTVKG